MFVTLLVCGLILAHLGDGAYVRGLAGSKGEIRRYRRQLDQNGELAICCGSEEMQFSDLSEECLKLAQVDEKLSGDERDIAELIGLACAAECQEESNGILTKGVFNKEKHLEELQEMYDMDWALKLADKIYENCKSDAEKIHAVMKKVQEFKCSLVAFFLDLCLISAVELSCPKDKMIMSTACNEMRKNYNASEYKQLLM